MQLKLINIHDGLCWFHLIDDNGKKSSVSVVYHEDLEKVKLEAILKSQKFVENERIKVEKMKTLQAEIDKIDLDTVNFDDINIEYNNKY